jgi:DNA-binding GntR family transcriptional regulator
MVEADRALAGRPGDLARANKRFHRQLHRASHNRYLDQMLQGMRRSLALLSTTSLAVPGRGAESVAEHDAIVRAIEARDEAEAETAARRHISNAYVSRLRIIAEG